MIYKPEAIIVDRSLIEFERELGSEPIEQPWIRGVQMFLAKPPMLVVAFPSKMLTTVPTGTSSSCDNVWTPAKREFHRWISCGINNSWQCTFMIEINCLFQINIYLYVKITCGLRVMTDDAYLAFVWIHQNIQQTVLLIAAQSIALQTICGNQPIVTFCVFSGNVVIRGLSITVALLTIFQHDVVIVVTIAVDWDWAGSIVNAIDNQRWAHTILRRLDGAGSVTFRREVRMMRNRGMSALEHWCRNWSSRRQGWHWMW